jgi:hypothetical protein
LDKKLATAVVREINEWQSPLDSFYQNLMAVPTDHYLVNGGLGGLGNPTDGHVAYPVHKRRTYETTLELQEAEHNLDKVWEHLDAAITTRAPTMWRWAQENLQHRTLSRTPDWVDVPSPLKPPLSI